MPRARTTKGVAKRIDLTYYKQMHPFRWWWRVLCFGVVGVGILWLLVEAIRGDQRIYTSGTVSIAHQMIDPACERCHAQIPRPAPVPAAAAGPGAAAAPPAPSATPPPTPTPSPSQVVPVVHTGGGFFQKVSDGACLVCHDGSIHHENQTVEPACAVCHVEHQGRTTLVRFSDRHCTTCHADLKPNTKGGAPTFEPRVVSLREHPEFAVFRKSLKDTAAIKLSHETHLKEGLPAGGGKRVTLACEACHKEDAAGQYILPIVYETHCAQCHPLEVGEGLTVPHEKPEIVRGFLLARLAAGRGGSPTAAPAPAPQAPAGDVPATEPEGGGRRRRGGPGTSLRELIELVQLRGREAPVQLAQRRRGGGTEESPAPAESSTGGGEPAGRRRGGAEPAQPAPAPAPAQVPGKGAPAGAAALAAVADAEKELFTGRQGCKYCHTLEEGEQGLPKIVSPKIPNRWLHHSAFNHRVHRPLNCVACHAGAPKSVETSDILMPKIQVCRDCHRSGGGARHDCTECHLYHDRAKERPAQGPFMVPEFVTGRPRAAAPTGTKTP